MKGLGTDPPDLALQWLLTGQGAHTVVAMVRHGHVDNPQGLRYGHLRGFHLSDQGKTQAQALANAMSALRPFGRVLRSSPLERALQTMAPIERILELQAATDQRLIEAWSILDGQPRHALLFPAYWRMFLNPGEPSWAEPFARVAARSLAAVRDAELQARGGLAVLVSHQSPIWLAVLAAEQEIPNFGAAFKATLPPWLLRPRRCATGTATLLLYRQGKLVRTLPPWQPVVGTHPEPQGRRPT